MVWMNRNGLRIGYSFNECVSSMVKIFECVCFSMGKIEWHFSMAYLVENHSMGKIEWHFSMAFLVEIHSMCVFSMGNFRW